jgi:hypothetical protein
VEQAVKDPLTLEENLTPDPDPTAETHPPYIPAAAPAAVSTAAPAATPAAPATVPAAAPATVPTAAPAAAPAAGPAKSPEQQNDILLYHSIHHPTSNGQNHPKSTPIHAPD